MLSSSHHRFTLFKDKEFKIKQKKQTKMKESRVKKCAYYKKDWEENDEVFRLQGLKFSFTIIVIISLGLLFTLMCAVIVCVIQKGMVYFCQ